MQSLVLSLDSSPCKEDLISKLPDEILESIISLLSTREAAKTTVLSQRWKNLWKTTIVFTPRLVFYNTDIFSFSQEQSKCEKYMNEVSQIMKLHEAPTLEELRIGFSHTLRQKYCDNTVNKWIKFAAEKQVQKLKLDVFCHQYSSDNRRLYWPRLRDCCMRKVNMHDKDIKCLVSNSPFLERLCVHSYFVRDLVVSKAPNLKYLEIRGGSNMRCLKISAPNLNHLIICHRRDIACKPFRFVRLCAPNLVRLRFCGTVGSQSPIVFVDSPPPDLSHVSLGLKNSELIGCHLHKIKFECFRELLGQFPQVKRLRLDLERLVFGDIVERIDINQQFYELTNLEHLEMSISCPYDKVKSFLWLCPLVKAAPYLHTLSIKLSYLEKSYKKVNLFYSGLIDFEWKDEDIPNKVKADIRHSHKFLKVVELFGFTGFRSQVELILYLVEIAVSLEKIIIDVRIPWNYWEDDILICSQNNSGEKSRACAQLLKTQIPSEIDVIVV